VNPLDLILEPLTYPFMRNGLLELVLLAAAAGAVGSLVVLRGLTFFGHALSHTVFPGIVLAYLLGLAPVVGALAAAAATVGLIAALLGRPRLGSDSAIGIVFLGFFALGITLVGLFRVRAAAIGDALVGNILGVGGAELLQGAVLALLVIAGLWLTYPGQVLAAFDRATAAARGLPVALLDALLLALVALTAVVAVQVVGAILTVAVLVTPAAAARPWARRLPRMMALAAAIAALAGAAGLYAAYYVPVAASAVIVLALTAAFAMSLGLHRILEQVQRSKFKVQSGDAPL
jgi:ABC-type Mn2+/Zn2+ transport system permease subunit